MIASPKILSAEKQAQYLRILRIMSWSGYIIPAVVLVLLLVYSKGDFWSIIILIACTLLYLRAYIGQLENQSLKGKILKDKDPSGRLYKVALFSSRILFFLVFVFLEANILPQLAAYNPHSLGIIIFFFMQSLLVMHKLNLTPSPLEAGTKSETFSEFIKSTLFYWFVLSAVTTVSMFAFILGLIALLSDLVREVSVTIFITTMLGTLIWAFLAVIKWIAKFMKPVETDPCKN